MRRYFLVEFEGEEEDLPEKQSLFEAIDAYENGVIQFNRSEILQVEHITARDIEKVFVPDE